MSVALARDFTSCQPQHPPYSPPSCLPWAREGRSPAGVPHCLSDHQCNNPKIKPPRETGLEQGRSPPCQAHASALCHTPTSRTDHRHRFLPLTWQNVARADAGAQAGGEGPQEPEREARVRSPPSSWARRASALQVLTKGSRRNNPLHPHDFLGLHPASGSSAWKLGEPGPLPGGLQWG